MSKGSFVLDRIEGESNLRIEVKLLHTNNVEEASSFDLNLNVDFLGQLDGLLIPVSQGCITMSPQYV